MYCTMNFIFLRTIRRLTMENLSKQILNNTTVITTIVRSHDPKFKISGLFVLVYIDSLSLLLWRYLVHPPLQLSRN